MQSRPGAGPALRGGGSHRHRQFGPRSGDPAQPAKAPCRRPAAHRAISSERWRRQLQRRGRTRRRVVVRLPGAHLAERPVVVRHEAGFGVPGARRRAGCRACRAPCGSVVLRLVAGVQPVGGRRFVVGVWGWVCAGVGWPGCRGGCRGGGGGGVGGGVGVVPVVGSEVFSGCRGATSPRLTAGSVNHFFRHWKGGAS